MHTPPFWAGGLGPALQKWIDDNTAWWSSYLPPAGIYQVSTGTWGGRAFPLTGHLSLTHSLVSLCMEIWDDSKTTVLLCCWQSLWGCERLVLQDCVVASRWGLCSGVGGRRLLMHGELWAIELVFVWYTWGQSRKKQMVSGCLTDRSRVGLKHTEKTWSELLISNKLSYPATACDAK